MRVALEAFGHVRHFGSRCKVAAHLAVLVILLALSLKFLPTGDKLVGTVLSCFANLLLCLHGKDGAADLPACGFVRQRLVGCVSALYVAGIVRAKSVQLVTSYCKLLPHRRIAALLDKLIKRRAVFLRQEQCADRTGVTPKGCLRPDLAICFRRGSLRQAQAVKHAAHLFRHLADDLGNALAEADAPPFGKAPFRFVAAIIRSHVFGPLA